ncbi:MAG TPA: translocation/assembly module TamB domain-containing protein [Gemmatimonadaceae bacterium]
MSRRRLVVLASASVMLLLGLIVVAVVLAVTQTAFGRERVRRYLTAQIAAGLGKRGSMYIGRISGSLFTSVVIDSFAIRDDEDSVFVATGPVRVTYDPRDLIDKRLLLSYLEVDRPVVHLRRHADRVWNYRRIFPEGPKTPRAPGRRFGDYIVIDSAVIHDGTFVLTEPWSPPDSLVGARRDSAVRVALTSPAHEIRRTSEGLKQTRRWRHIELRSPFVRIANPDSAGRLVSVGSLAAEENDPPFRFRNVRGPVRILGDSVWLDVRHFDLPGSTGSASGKVWWGGTAPTRYDVHVVADSMSLADIAWVYPTLPTTGGGRLTLTIRNEPRDLHVLDYAIRDMNVRSTRSHVTGAMTFGVGGPVLVVKDVNVRADPIDFALLRAFNGGPFPVDWAGRFTGTIRARGGPIDRWLVDDARLSFADAHVPGAVSRFTARGGLDILEPALATFRGLDVRVETLDFRTPRYLFPSFPRLRGTASGTARLDSVWTDLRFSDADVLLHDGPGAPSRFTGHGRVTYGTLMSFDVDLQAKPVSFTTLARSYPLLRFRGPYEGPLRASGTSADMALTTTLAGPGGTLAWDGRIDISEPGYAARGTAAATDLDPAVLLQDSALVPMRLNGRAEVDVRGDSLANLAGTALVSLDRSRVDSTRFDPSTAVLAFGGGHLRIDSLWLQSSAGQLLARGGLGLVPGARDSLHFELAVDSLGGLRPYLGRPPATRAVALLASADSATPAELRAARAEAIRDSLAGTLRAEGDLIGSIDTLAARGTFGGSDLFVGGNAARRLDGAFAFAGLPGAPVGTARVTLDSMLVAGVRLDSAAAALAMRDPATGTLLLAAARGGTAGSVDATARVAFQRTGDSLHVTVDSVAARLGADAWTLAGPAHVLFDTTGTTIDSLVLHSSSSRVAFGGTFPAHRAVHGMFEVDSFPLADIGALLQTARPLSGVATLAVGLGGERERPTIRGAGRFADVRYGDAAFPYFTATASYADQRLRPHAEVYRDRERVLTLDAVLPMDLSLVSVEHRLLDDPLSARIRADSVDLSLLEALSPQFTRVTGAASTELDVGGTWEHPQLSGRFTIHDGEMGLPSAGIRLRDVSADIAFTPDSVRIARLSMASGTEENSSLSVTGALRVPDWRDTRDAGFDITARARNFQVLDKRAMARLEVSGDVRLRGTLARPELGGDLTVNRGTLFVSELNTKQVVNLDDPDFYDIVDTSLVVNRDLIRSAYLDTLIANLRVPSLSVHVGDDVWLRSEEANIKLAGDVALEKVGSQRLESGTLEVSRGTYRLNLGLVLRTFEVDSGKVVFYGDPNIPPSLSIWATYTVRQASRESGQDVKIIAHIGGTLVEPRLALSSQERIPLSDTEILSYLVFGQPTVATSDFANPQHALDPVARALLPSVGGVLERALADQISFIDYVQVQTGAGTTTTDQTITGRNALNALAGTRIGVGKQIGERTFLTVNAGLCGLAGAQASGSQSFAQSLGVTVNYRLNDGYSLQASSEPSTTALQCSAGLSGIGTRPRQYGFDLFREWSF